MRELHLIFVLLVSSCVREKKDLLLQYPFFSLPSLDGLFFFFLELFTHLLCYVSNSDMIVAGRCDIPHLTTTLTFFHLLWTFISWSACKCHHASREQLIPRLVTAQQSVMQCLKAQFTDHWYYADRPFSNLNFMCLRHEHVTSFLDFSICNFWQN